MGLSYSGDGFGIIANAKNGVCFLIVGGRLTWLVVVGNFGCIPKGPHLKTQRSKKTKKKQHTKFSNIFGIC